MDEQDTIAGALNTWEPLNESGKVIENVSIGDDREQIDPTQRGDVWANAVLLNHDRGHGR